MYNKLRTELIEKLIENEMDYSSFINIVDEVMTNYSVSKRNMELIPYNEYQIPKLVKTYLVTKYIEQLSKNTLDNYKLYLNLFFSTVKLQPEQITTEHIRAYLLKYQRERNISPRSLNQMRRCICTFFKWAYEEGYLSKDICKSIKSFKFEYERKTSINKYDIEKIRLACNCERESALIEFMLSTGCRIEEISNVKISDIDFKENTVNIIGKGNKHRIVFLNVKSKVVITRYLTRRNYNSDYLFCNIRGNHDKLSTCGIRKIFNSICQRAGVNYTPHQMRHTTATVLIEHGMPLNSVKEVLGHSKIDTTLLYIDSNHKKIKTEYEKYMY